MGPIQVVVQDGNNLVLEVTPTPNTTVILDRGIAGPPGPAGTGDVNGPASATDNAVARFDGTTGKLIQNSVVTIGDTGNIAGVGTLAVTDLTDSSLTSGRVIYAGTGGNLVDSANLTFNGTTLTANALTVTNAVTLSAATANGVMYANGSKVLTTGSALTFDGSAFSTTGTINAGTAAKAYRVANWTLAGYSGNTLQFGNATTGGEWTDMSWSIAGSEQMRLTSTGLGIGTSSPLTPLHAVGAIQSQRTGGVAQYARMVNSGGTATFISDNQASGTYTGFDFQGLSTASGSPVTYATINGSGNLGLGVTPSAWASGWKSQQVGTLSALADTGSVTYLGNNWYQNTSSNNIYLTSTYASLYGQTAGNHIWYTAPSGTAGNAISFTQAMTLDASGNLGVGTTSPARRLSVSGSTAYARLTDTDTGGSGSVEAAIEFYANDGQKASIGYPGNDDFILNVVDNKNLRFWTNNTERARIDSSGTFSVSSPLSTSYVGTFINTTSSGNVNCLNTSLNSNGNNTNSSHMRSITQDVNAWFLYGNGTMSWSSDQRLKKNIETTRNGYIDDLCKLRVVKYNWHNHEDGAPKELGLIAQEVEQVFPNLVQEVDDGTVLNGIENTKVIKGSVLPFMLLKAIQELKAEFDAYKASHP